MRLFLATIATYRQASEGLTEVNFNDRLVSYYLLKNHSDEVFTHYVETGIAFRKPKNRKRNWKDNRVTYLRIRRLALAKRLRSYEDEGE